MSDQVRTVRLTVESETGEVESFSATGTNIVAALSKVTTAAWAVHRMEMLAQWETIKEAARLLGHQVPTTEPRLTQPHGVTECADPDCPWHRRG